MFTQDSAINSSSDDEGVMSHFVLSKPRKTPYSALKQHPKEKDVWPMDMLLCGGASLCAVIIALVLTVGYTVFVHSHVLHLEKLVQTLQTGNSSEPSSLSYLKKMSAAQMERVRMLSDMTELAQFQDNLSSVHNQFVTLQRFYNDMEENPNIVQFLSSIMDQMTPLSQSVVLMSDGLHDIQKTVEVIEVDQHALLQSLDDLNAMTHNLETSVTALRDEAHLVESRLSTLELLQPGFEAELNLSALYAQLKKSLSLESDNRMRDLQTQVANTSHLIQRLDNVLIGVQADFHQLKNAILDETKEHQLVNRIAELEEKLSSVLAINGNSLNVTQQGSSNVSNGDSAVSVADVEPNYER